MTSQNEYLEYMHIMLSSLYVSNLPGNKKRMELVKDMILNINSRIPAIEQADNDRIIE